MLPACRTSFKIWNSLFQPRRQGKQFKIDRFWEPRRGLMFRLKSKLMFKLGGRRSTTHQGQSGKKLGQELRGIRILLIRQTSTVCLKISLNLHLDESDPTSLKWSIWKKTFLSFDRFMETKTRSTSLWLLSLWKQGWKALTMTLSSSKSFQLWTKTMSFKIFGFCFQRWWNKDNKNTLLKCSQNRFANILRKLRNRSMRLSEVTIEDSLGLTLQIASLVRLTIVRNWAYEEIRPQKNRFMLFFIFSTDEEPLESVKHTHKIFRKIWEQLVYS